MIMIIFWLGAHRALPDVLAMERVILHPSLSVCLSNVLTRCPQHQLKLWLDKKQLYMKSAQLIKCFGKPALTSAQAKKLVSKNLLLDDLKIIQREVGSEAEFHSSLKTKGINSQPLREKLWKALKRLASS